jgi:hypothetical protein
MQTVEDRFWSKVDRTAYCWNWTAGTRASGYGSFYWNGKNWSAHRVSFTLTNGPIPEGLVIDHICRNTGCVRPEHLRAVTQRVNVMAGQTIPAAEASKTVCDNGHPLSGENLRIDVRGWRCCVTCEQARWERARQSPTWKHASEETAHRVYVWLYGQADQGHVEASYEHIRSDLALGHSTVERAVRRLIDGGLVVVERPGSGHHPTRYSIPARAGGTP